MREPSAARLDRVDPILGDPVGCAHRGCVVWIAPFVFIVFTSLKANSTVMGSSAFAPPTSLEWTQLRRRVGARALQHDRAQQRCHHDHQGAARPADLGDGGLCPEPHPTAGGAGDFSPRAVRNDAAVPGDARAAVHAGQFFRAHQHQGRHHFALSRFRRAISGVHPSRFLQRSAERTERGCARRRRVALHHLPPHLPSDLAPRSGGACSSSILSPPGTSSPWPW